MTIHRSAVLAGALAITVAGICLRLGFWQLDRLEQRRGFNDAYAAALELPPVELGRGGLALLREEPDELLFRRASARGSFEHGDEFLLRGRSHEGRPGVHLVTPFRLEGTSEVLLVNRGWLPSPDAATADPRPYRQVEPRVVTGVLQAVPEAPDQASPVTIRLEGETIASFRRLDGRTLANGYGRNFSPLYLQETSQLAIPQGLPIAVPLPTFDEGSHLGYAIQWFSFAAIAIVGFGLMVHLRVRRDRRPQASPPAYRS